LKRIPHRSFALSTISFRTPEEKRRYVQAMFARMAGHYDMMNRILSLGRDMAWRRTLVERANVPDGGLVLDVAAGTGDVTRILAARTPARRVVALDFSRPMLRIAQWKLGRLDGTPGASLVQADGLRLPFADNTFDSVTSAFALRNAVDVAALFAEMWRVLRPCGRVACMEICQPTAPAFRPLFGLYFNRIVPLLGRVLVRDPEAYTYLPESLNRFMTSAQVMRTLEGVGFRSVACQKLMLGTVAIYVGVKG
jgi:demethylmenaquinone methyltransferase/2-methoxy-6-polyprenyl-1,4-benzoquinol methylase